MCKNVRLVFNLGMKPRLSAQFKTLLICEHKTRKIIQIMLKWYTDRFRTAKMEFTKISGILPFQDFTGNDWVSG